MQRHAARTQRLRDARIALEYLGVVDADRHVAQARIPGKCGQNPTDHGLAGDLNQALVADTSDLSQRVRTRPSPGKNQDGRGARVSGRGLHGCNSICPAPACNAIGRPGRARRCWMVRSRWASLPTARQDCFLSLLITFARAYPGRSAAMLGCLVLAALAEGIGLSSMMPLLEIITRSEGSGPVEIDGEGSTLERIVVRILASFGLSPTVGALLSLIVAGICVRAVLVLIAQRQVGYLSLIHI